jgi:hypothetical protein
MEIRRFTDGRVSVACHSHYEIQYHVPVKKTSFTPADFLMQIRDLYVGRSYVRYEYLRFLDKRTR